MQHETILVVDFGGQYNQLIARRVRDLNVYCEVISYKKALAEITEKKPIGIILTGGPNSVYAEGSPLPEKALFETGVPVLGICYGMQAMAYTLGGEVKSPDKREYGRTLTITDTASPLFKDVDMSITTWMSHTDYVSELPQNFACIAHTDSCPNAAMENPQKNLYAVQFHPEVMHTQFGNRILDNFLVNVCHAKKDWSMAGYVETAINELKEKIGDNKVLLALSGGVDSSVCAALLDKAVGEQLTCIFVDHGLMRKNEGDEVEEAFSGGKLNFVRVDASERFLKELAGVSDPEKKRKIIGEEFIRVFEEEAKKIGKVDFLAQGTIYPDIIESGLNGSATIKSHHNVGGLPECVDFEDIVEPLRLLFKDEVRRLGKELGLADYLVNRQPFPGPGLAVRVIGDITKEKLDILREADYIFRSELATSGEDMGINQFFAVLTNLRSVGVMGDERTYDYAIALRAVTTDDFMTADWAKIPYEVLERTSSRIVNEVRGVNRVLYDVTSKPPATIEFE